ncbi:MAG: hypothetical protein JO234_01175 [Hyphomicrobiales bacterium]|nr:hypothetical protein [Hyphomicrobiales bacterium]
MDFLEESTVRMARKVNGVAFPKLSSDRALRAAIATKQSAKIRSFIDFGQISSISALGRGHVQSSRFTRRRHRTSRSATFGVALFRSGGMKAAISLTQ